MPVSNSAVAAILNADLRLQVFVVGWWSESLYTCPQVTRDAPADFGDWKWIGLPSTFNPWDKEDRDRHSLLEIAVGKYVDGSLVLFALSGDGHCYQTSESTPGGGWSTWRDIGANEWKQIWLSSNADGRLELFALVDGDVYHLWQTSPRGGWSSSERFGTVGVDQIAVARNADGRLEVFALVAGDVWHFWQTSPGGDWSSSERFGTVGVNQIAVASNADGRLEVFALIGGDTWHFWQTSPGGSWSSSERFGTVGVNQIAVARNADGRLEVFALIAGDIWHFWQTSPGGGWSSSQRFGTIGVDQITVASNADGNLELFVVAGYELYRIWQTGPGNWSTSQEFPDPESPPWVTFKATPDHIVAGNNATLLWTSGNAYFVEIEPGVGSVPLNGSKQVSPAAKTDYTITATGLGGAASLNVSVDVTVPPPPPPPLREYSQLLKLTWWGETNKDDKTYEVYNNMPFPPSESSIDGEITSILNINSYMVSFKLSDDTGTVDVAPGSKLEGIDLEHVAGTTSPPKSIRVYVIPLVDDPPKEVDLILYYTSK